MSAASYRRRRVAAVVLALTLLIIAVVLALVLPRGRADLPAALPSPSLPGASSGPSPSFPRTSGTASAGSALPTDTPEAGQDPAPAPVTVPATPAPSGPGTRPAPPFPAALDGQDLAVIPEAGRVVALTFDAGANAAGLAKILSTLSARGVAGTFFLTGSWASANPSGVRQIVAAGHRIANHSMTHPGFTALSDAQIAEQVLDAQEAILAAGADPRPFFRFPFGERNAHTIAAVNELGYAAVRWTVDSLGWKGTSGGVSAQIVADRVLGSLQPGEIVLMHIGSNPDDGSTLDADALPLVIDRIRAAGYGFTTLDALLH